jgi:hypothetical protein
MPKKLAGGKYAPTHTSVTEAALAPAKAAAALPCVSKVILGIITPIRNGPISIKFLDEGVSCLLAKVRGPRSLQEIRVYATDKRRVMEAMELALAN